MPSVLVLGARNLGGAILDHLLSSGWSGAAVARSEETLERVRARGALGLEADAADPEALREAIARARAELDGLDLLVNAVSAARPPSGGGGGFGGGPIADATIEDWRGWGGAVAEQGFAFLSESARALREQGRGGTIVQVTGGSARRAMPGRGLWSAGAQSVRALVHAAAQELRERRHPRRAADRGRDDRVAQDRRLHPRRPARLARRPGRDRPRGRLPGRPVAARLEPRADRDPVGGSLDAVIGTLLAGPRLVLRAFDDLHQIALAARELPEFERRLIARVDDAQQVLEDALVAAEALPSLDARAAALLEVAQEANQELAELRDAGRRLDVALASAEKLEAAANKLALAAEPMAAAAEPLTGAAERLGRIADRLPRGRRPV